jgi:hypothetical protein
MQMRRKAIHLNVIAGVMLAIGSRSGCSNSQADETWYKLRAAHAGVFYFSQSQGRLPGELAEVCVNASWCRLMSAEQWFRDGWGTSIRYLPTATGYVLTSAGADRRFATNDDQVFDTAVDRERAEQLAGCFGFPRRFHALDHTS